jgi:HAD superfamily hydrolase (TIGR01509 family)
VAVTAIVFDMGETLVDETRQREEIAAGAGRATPFTEADLYSDALPCIRALREQGIVVGVVGNMAQANETFIAPHVDWVGSSERWGVSKPAPEFFARVVQQLDRPPHEIAYVGDRVDNDVEPALAAGMTAVHLRRGPWGTRHETPAGARRIESLLELV